MTGIERVFLGATAGFVSVLSKFMAHDYNNVAKNFTNLTADQVINYQVGYAILTPILIIIGAFIAWISDEPNRLKLVALAISAAALIRTWAGGERSLQASQVNPFVTSAYAQSTNRTGPPSLSASAASAATTSPSKPSDLSTFDRVR